MSTPQPKPRPKPTATDKAVAKAAADALAAASEDEAVKAAFRDLLMDAAVKARQILNNGTPDRQDKVLQMFAAPAVRSALTPRGDDNTGTELDEFHKQRQAVFGGIASVDDAGDTGS